ncbi:sensor histidine kinase [Romboutsia lituseburensis]|uniref:sensor histidine kinase n=1 Tax=Romboutsia lituseburensis TaxID=1537 RepID=UPI00215A9469|nr:sensor histidine kinase [Romboutsia lituseburensis]MCR8745579.1 GHKL domain-containing protein [Romboutsia lituseburensis]
MNIENYINTIAFVLLPMLGNIFFTYICFYFMGKVEKNIYKKKSAYILVYLIFTIIVSAVSLLGNGLLNLLTITIGTILVGSYYYNNSRKYKIYYIAFSVCLFICDILATGIITIVISLLNIHIQNIAYYQIVLVISIRLIEFIYCKLAVLFINRRNASKLTIMQTLGFIIIQLFSLIYMFSLFSYIQIFSRIEDTIILNINVLLILIINVYITYMFDSISKKNILENEVNLYKQQSELQYKYYDNLEKKYQGSRKLAHDIRNHLYTIEELYKINDTNSAKEYTNDIHKMLNELNQRYYTSNKVLNIILNDKFDYIKEKDIDIICRIGDVDLSFIRDIDITTIFANLLDNAIEATLEIDKNAYIKLDINKFNELLVINISNSIINKPIYKNKKFKSTKENHNGLGIENIKKSLEKYDGTMMIDYKEDEFKVNIVIPI